MRGLPAIPDGVLDLQLVFAFDRPAAEVPARRGRGYTTTLRFYAPGLDLLPRDRQIEMMDTLAYQAINLAVKVTTQSTWVVEYRYRYHGPHESVHLVPTAVFNGAWDGDTFANVAVAIYWRDGRPGRHGHAISYFPSCPHRFTDDGAQLNSAGYIDTRNAAITFLDDVNGVRDEYDTPLALCVVRRQRDRAPMPRALVTLVDDAVPCIAVADMGRRRARRPHVTPL